MEKGFSNGKKNSIVAEPDSNVEVPPANPKKQMAKNYFYLMLLQTFNYVLPLLTLPYLVRVLGAEKYGVIAFSASFVIYFMILTDFGFNLSATREISVNRHNTLEVKRIFSSVLAVKGMLTIVGFIILCIVLQTTPKFHEYKTVILLTYGTVIGQAIFPIWLFQGMEKMGFITFLNLLSKLIFTVAVFIFVKNENDYYWVPATQSIGYLAAGLLGLWFSKMEFNVWFVRPRFKEIKATFIDSSMYFMSRVSVSIYTSSNAFILGLVTTNEMVGFYAIAEKLYLAIQGVFTPISNVVYPYMIKYKDNQTFRRIFRWVVFVNTLGCVLLMCVAETIFNILFGGGNELAISAFKVFLIVAIITGPSILIGYPLLAGSGLVKSANYSVIYGAILHCVGLIVLWVCGFISVFTIVWLVLITELSILLYRLHHARKVKGWLVRES